MLFLFGFLILAGIASGKIDISQLLEEKGSDGTNGGASMGRFQLLIFTFVIGLSFFTWFSANVTCRRFPRMCWLS